MKAKIAILTLTSIPLFSYAKAPDCYSWPMNIAMGWMKNSNIVQIVDLDLSRTENRRLASEKKGKDLYTQVYYFTFHGKDGKVYNVITESDASNEECSMGSVNTYLIQRSEINH